MRPIKARTAVIAAVLALVVASLSAWAARAETAAVRNCTWCHGPAAQGYNPAPRLAGQRLQYIESQIRGFQGHVRDNPDSRQYMWAAAEHVSPQRAHDLAMYFSTLPARAANDGLRELTATGRTIYRDGIPEANIVACIACHGPNAEGAGDIPRLGGLAYTYLKRQLKQWGEGYNAAARHPMPRVASRLSSEQIQALASYLSFVP
jgi:cytochrome c553